MLQPMGVALVMALVVSFRIVGAGTPTAPATNQAPCPDGKWTQAILAASSPRRIGTDYGCALSIRKTDRANWGVYRITQTARELLVLPNGTITAVVHERFDFARDQRHVRVTWNGTVTHATGHYARLRGTISGSGPIVDGRANYRLTLRLR